MLKDVIFKNVVLDSTRPFSFFTLNLIFFKNEKKNHQNEATLFFENLKLYKRKCTQILYFWLIIQDIAIFLFLKKRPFQ